MKICYSIIILLCLFMGIQTVCMAMSDLEMAQKTVFVLRLADWSQTREIAVQPPGGIYELNPILGKHPTLEEVNNYFIALLLTDYIIKKFGSEKINQYWFGVNVTMECVCVGNNYMIGIKGKFN